MLTSEHQVIPQGSSQYSYHGDGICRYQGRVEDVDMASWLNQLWATGLSARVDFTEAIEWSIRSLGVAVAVSGPARVLMAGRSHDLRCVLGVGNWVGMEEAQVQRRGPAGLLVRMHIQLWKIVSLSSLSKCRGYGSRLARMCGLRMDAGGDFSVCRRQ